MPRHNSQRLPRHRAPRRVDDSPRRVRVRAAISAARAALAVTRHDEADAAGQQPSYRRSWRRRRTVRWRPPRPSAAARVGRRTVVRGAARSLLVTPWFAAGTGFVIATGLWIYAPHTELRFPDSSAGASQCESRGCATDSPSTDPGEVATGPAQKIAGAQAKKHSRTVKTDVVTDKAAGLKFKFTILWQNGSRFGAYVTVSGHTVPSSWRLSFAIPGVRIDYVTGVSWLPDTAGDGGTASAPPWQESSGKAQDADGNDTSGVSDDPVISFSVTGTGSASIPNTCRFDGSACSFH
jgi:hypothetical protein